MQGTADTVGYNGARPMVPHLKFKKIMPHRPGDEESSGLLYVNKYILVFLIWFYLYIITTLRIYS